MGNTRSSVAEEDSQDIWWTNGTQQSHNTSQSVQAPNSDLNVSETPVQEIDTQREQRRKELAEDFEKFKLELARKHEKRRQLLAEKRKEMTDIRDELIVERQKNEELRELFKKATEKMANNKCDSDNVRSNKADLITIKNLKEENEDLRIEVDKLRLQIKENAIIAEKNKELRISLAEMQKELQSVNTEVIGFEKERIDYQEHVTALKDVVKVSKEMLAVREKQTEELRKKITGIEELLASKEMNILSDDLRHEYERQLRNIRNLRTLYEERQRADKKEKENLQSRIDELKKDLEEEQQKKKELQETLDAAENENSEKYDQIKNLESNLGLSKAECKELQAEMAVINQLFSQILLGFNNDQDIDLDNLIKILEENHDLLTNIVINEESNEVSALPKVLLDLVNQVNEIKQQQTETSRANQNVTENANEEKLTTIAEETDSQLTATHQLNSSEEIVENLPKVWRVLIELLSHQCAPNNVLTESVPKTGENDHPCYKSIQTPTGTRSVLSVSKTFIRLKDLILEKKFLEKETGRLKHLNTHLEGRLQDQEKRLVLVSSELSKTWHVVGKMQKQHQQLHTQEKIMRYELAQKRKLLTELKEELEYCRDKWMQARKKNSCTEEQWKQLKTEFSSRKTGVNDDCNNSVESGYSDDKSSSDDEEHEFAAEVPKSYEKALLEDETSTSTSTATIDRTLVEHDQSVAAEPPFEEDSSSSIFDVVKKEIAVIENDVEETHSFVEDSTNQVPHSSETQKTDLVQDSNDERHENSVLPSDEALKLQVSTTTEEPPVYDTRQANSLLSTVTVERTSNFAEQQNETNETELDLQTRESADRDPTTQVAENFANQDNNRQSSEELQPEDNTALSKDVKKDTVIEELQLEDNVVLSEEFQKKRIGETDVKPAEPNLQAAQSVVKNQTQVADIFATQPEVTTALSVEDLKPSTSTDELVLQKADAVDRNQITQVTDNFVNQDDNNGQTLEDLQPESDVTVTVESNNIHTGEENVQPNTSTGSEQDSQTSTKKTPSQSAEEFVARREERMKRLEEQCEQLYFKVATTTLKGVKMSYKLDGLHEIYGEGSQDESSSTPDIENVEENPNIADSDQSNNEQPEK